MVNAPEHQPKPPVASAAPSSTSEGSVSQGNGTASTEGGAAPASARSLPPEALALAAKLFDFARRGDLSSLTPYLSAGIPANLTNSSGDTLLMLASYYGHAALVSHLLSIGADPDVLNDKGQSPIAGAVFKGFEEVVRILVEQGKADIRNGHPNAVDTAAMFRKWECAKIMDVEEEARSRSTELNPVGARDQL